MASDLMQSSGQWCRGQQRDVARLAVGDGHASNQGAGLDARSALTTSDGIVDVQVLDDFPAHDGQVVLATASGLCPLRNGLCRFRVLGEKDGTARTAIEALDGVSRSVPGPTAGKVRENLLGLGPPAMHEQSGRLVENEQLIVFVQTLDVH